MSRGATVGDTLVEIDVPKSTVGGDFSNGWSTPVEVPGLGKKGMWTKFEILYPVASSHNTEIEAMVFYGEDLNGVPYDETTDPTSVIQPRRPFYEDGIIFGTAPYGAKSNTENVYELNVELPSTGTGLEPYRVRSGKVYAALRAKATPSDVSGTEKAYMVIKTSEVL